jgi:predicted Rossmann-fold nucleotide-binding protein
MNAFEKELKKKDFRVAIFGSARIKRGDKIFKEVFNLAKGIVKLKADMVTGGGPGIMEAASHGHEAGSPKNDSDTIGLNIQLSTEQEPNKYLDIVEDHATFSRRLDHFMKLSNVIVVTKGGIGTCLELFFTWQLIQVNHIQKMPIILMGSMWEDLIRWAKKWMLKQKLVNKADFDCIFIAKNNKEAMKIIEKAQKAFKKGGAKECINWKKY